jgi:hypothetical protein
VLLSFYSENQISDLILKPKPVFLRLYDDSLAIFEVN